MDNEILNRLEKIEKNVNNKQKDFWEKLQALTPILIPLTIALVGWYYTDQQFKNQIEIQKINNENQLKISQSELIGTFMEHLSSKDSSTRKIAITALLYAAPGPGKNIVDIIVKTGDTITQSLALDALFGKRNDLINNLFSTEKLNRTTAAGEIISNWNTDSAIIAGLITKSLDCLNNKNNLLDCENGVFNTIVVLNSFSRDKLKSYSAEIMNLINNIPNDYKQTLSYSRELQKKLQ